MSWRLRLSVETKATARCARNPVPITVDSGAILHGPRGSERGLPLEIGEHSPFLTAAGAISRGTLECTAVSQRTRSYRTSGPYDGGLPRMLLSFAAFPGASATASAGTSGHGVWETTAGGR